MSAESCPGMPAVASPALQALAQPSRFSRATAAAEEIAVPLLAYLGRHLQAPDLSYAAAPAALPDGWETYSYTFRLRGSGLPVAWEQPLLLRVHVGCQGLPRVRHEFEVQDHLSRHDSLTTIASGVLLGLLVFAFLSPDQWALGWRALALLAVVGVLLLPGVFNRLADRTARPFRQPDSPPLPRIRAATLVAGLGITSCGWLMQGAALWAVVGSLASGAWPGPLQAWGCCTGYVGVAYAAGFLVLAAPGGLGVRDFLIQHFLAEDLGRTLGADEAAGVAVVATLLLRLLWTVMDVAAAALCYWLPNQESGAKGEELQNANCKMQIAK